MTRSGATGPMLPAPVLDILTPIKPRSFISSNEYEVGQVIDLRVLRVRGFPDVPHVILSKKCYRQFGNSPQWGYEVARLPDNPMTVEDMEDIST